MRNFAILMLVLFLSYFAQSMPAEMRDILNGYGEGRPEAPYGVYHSTVSDQARDLQSRLLELEKKSFGIAYTALNDAGAQAELVFLLEVKLLKLYMDIINHTELSRFDKEALMFSTLRAYQNVRSTGERLYHDLVRFIDVKKPGPNGLQIKVEKPESAKHTLYFPNYRSDTKLSISEQRQAYQEKLKQFLDEGGKLSEMKPLTSQLVHEFQTYSRMEYIIAQDGRVWVTQGEAGHILLAKGQAVYAAGQIVLIKDQQGRPQLAVVSNASGSYKPDLVSVKLWETEISRAVGTANIIYTQGEPVGVQALKIYLKALDHDKAQIKSRTSELLQLAERELLNLPPSSSRALSCKKVLL